MAASTTIKLGLVAVIDGDRGLAYVDPRALRRVTRGGRHVPASLIGKGARAPKGARA